MTKTMDNNENKQTETARSGSLQRSVRHRSYDEACRDATASPADRENALLAEHFRAVREIEWLWATCKIVYWPRDDRYPIEHNPHARKYSRELIEAEMPNDQAQAQPPTAPPEREGDNQ